MSASALFSLGTKAMTASYAALATTGHNISNANVKGYSRQQVELATAEGQFSGAGFYGKGVDVSTVTRAHDAFLTREAATASSLAAMDAGRLDMLRQLESVFPTGEQGVGHAAGEFLNAMVDLSARPTDAATRQVVLARAGEVADRFAAAGQQLDVLQQQVQETLRANVAQVNQLAGSIAELNQRIASVLGLGHSPNDLLDQRDQALADLSQKLQLSTVEADDGSLTVFIAGGQRLVLGTQVQPLTVEVDPDDATRSALGLSDSGFVRLLQQQELGGGTITGLLRFQDDDLVDARTLLGQLAAALSGKINEQQALGLDLRDPPGSGAPIFEVGPAVAVPNANNAVDGAGQFVGQVSLSVTDASQLRASEYALRADPGGAPGVWELTRLEDGLVRSIGSGDVLDGLRIDIGPPAPAATDRYLLQPVTRAANGMQRVLDDVRGLAAASPLSASTPAANTGTGSVAALRVVSPAADPGPDGHHQLHQQQRRLQLGAARPPQQRAAVQRRRHLDGRHADHAERLRTRPERRAAQRRCLQRRQDAVSGVEQRQCLGLHRSARRCAGRPRAAVGRRCRRRQLRSPTPTQRPWPKSACACRARNRRQTSPARSRRRPRRCAVRAAASTSTRRRRG